MHFELNELNGKPTVSYDKLSTSGRNTMQKEVTQDII